MPIEMFKEDGEMKPYAKVSFVHDGITYELRSQTTGSNVIQIFGSTENSLTEDGDHYQLHNPDHKFTYGGDFLADGAEEDLIRTFYELPNIQQIVSYFNVRFSHLVNN